MSNCVNTGIWPYGGRNRRVPEESSFGNCCVRRRIFIRVDGRSTAYGVTTACKQAHSIERARSEGRQLALEGGKFRLVE